MLYPNSTVTSRPTQLLQLLHYVQNAILKQWPIKCMDESIPVINFLISYLLLFIASLKNNRPMKRSKFMEKIGVEDRTDEDAEESRNYFTSLFSSFAIKPCQVDGRPSENNPVSKYCLTDANSHWNIEKSRTAKSTFANEVLSHIQPCR